MSSLNEEISGVEMDTGMKKRKRSNSTHHRLHSSSASSPSRTKRSPPVDFESAFIINEGYEPWPRIIQSRYPTFQIGANNVLWRFTTNFIKQHELPDVRMRYNRQSKMKSASIPKRLHEAYWKYLEGLVIFGSENGDSIDDVDGGKSTTGIVSAFRLNGLKGRQLVAQRFGLSVSGSRGNTKLRGKIKQIRLSGVISTFESTVEATSNSPGAVEHCLHEVERNETQHQQMEDQDQTVPKADDTNYQPLNSSFSSQSIVMDTSKTKSDEDSALISDFLHSTQVIHDHITNMFNGNIENNEYHQLMDKNQSISYTSSSSLKPDIDHILMNYELTESNLEANVRENLIYDENSDDEPLLKRPFKLRRVKVEAA
ncbi:hypothetical protein HDU76_009277 [Blyttiomyces sp. JEL0837]|nr:hypothetical protein HDU76_009277 [Blyttiomyces sp. JEL0837]